MINIINWMSIFVLIIGGASLMIVLAGFSGLRTFSMSFSNYFDPDLKVLPKSGKIFSLTAQQEKALSQEKMVAHYSKILEERVFLNSQGKNYIAYIKGVDENYPKVNAVDSILVLSPKEWLLSDDYVVVGNIIAETLNLGLFTSTTPLQIIVPKAGKGSITSTSTPYREETVLLSDYYQVTEDLDSKYVFATLSLSQRLLGLKENDVSAIEIKLTKGISSEEGKKRLLSVLGMTLSQIRRIFFLQGAIISLLGAIFGIGLGVGIAWLQKAYPMLYINPNAMIPIPYPIDIRWSEIVVVFLTILILGIMASAIGASRTKIND